MWQVLYSKHQGRCSTEHRHGLQGASVINHPPSHLGLSLCLESCSVPRLAPVASRQSAMAGHRCVVFAGTAPRTVRSANSCSTPPAFDVDGRSPTWASPERRRADDLRPLLLGHDFEQCGMKAGTALCSVACKSTELWPRLASARATAGPHGMYGMISVFHNSPHLSCGVQCIWADDFTKDGLNEVLVGRILVIAFVHNMLVMPY